MALVSKRKIFLRSYLDDTNPTTFMNATESARAAGYKSKNNDHLRQIGYTNLRVVKKQVLKWMEEEGLTDKALKRKLFSLLHAKETKFFADKGEVVTQVEVEALHIQQRALDMAFKVSGAYAPQKHEHTGEDGGPIEVKASDLMNLKGLKDAIRKPKAK